MKVKLYQTLEDRDNPDDVENHGPFKCTRMGAWLGEGYYFWENYIDFAHLWGKNGGYEATGYLICQADAKIDDNCFDLYNNLLHREEFLKILELLKESGIIKRETVLVGEVISFFKKKGKFKYNAIRAEGNDTLQNKIEISSFIKRIKFTSNSRAYLELMPQIQICLLEKNALSLQNFSIVYPEKYAFNQYA